MRLGILDRDLFSVTQFISGPAAITRKDLFPKCYRAAEVDSRRGGKRNRGLRVDLCTQLITAGAIDYLLAK